MSRRLLSCGGTLLYFVCLRGSCCVGRLNWPRTMQFQPALVLWSFFCLREVLWVLRFQVQVHFFLRSDNCMGGWCWGWSAESMRACWDNCVGGCWGWSAGEHACMGSMYSSTKLPSNLQATSETVSAYLCVHMAVSNNSVFGTRQLRFEPFCLPDMWLEQVNVHLPHLQNEIISTYVMGL